MYSVYAQKKQALVNLMLAIETGNHEVIEKAKMYYRIPCYADNGTGKTDSDIRHDLYVLDCKARSAQTVIRSIRNRNNTALGVAMQKAGLDKGAPKDHVKGICYHVLNICNATALVLEGFLYKREQYRKGLLTAETVYLPHPVESIIEAEVPAKVVTHA